MLIAWLSIHISFPTALTTAEGCEVEYPYNEYTNSDGSIDTRLGWRLGNLSTKKYSKFFLVLI